jgi:hypothetical protein
MVPRKGLSVPSCNQSKINNLVLPRILALYQPNVPKSTREQEFLPFTPSEIRTSQRRGDAQCFVFAKWRGNSLHADRQRAALYIGRRYNGGPAGASARSKRPGSGRSEWSSPSMVVMRSVKRGAGIGASGPSITSQFSNKLLAVPTPELLRLDVPVGRQDGAGEKTIAGVRIKISIRSRNSSKRSRAASTLVMT